MKTTNDDFNPTEYAEQKYDGTDNKPRVDREKWLEFVESKQQVLRKKKKSVTARMLDMNFQELYKLQTIGIDPNERLEQAIANGWQGVWFDKDSRAYEREGFPRVTKGGSYNPNDPLPYKLRADPQKYILKSQGEIDDIYSQFTPEGKYINPYADCGLNSNKLKAKVNNGTASLQEKRDFVEQCLWARKVRLKFPSQVIELFAKDAFSDEELDALQAEVAHLDAEELKNAEDYF